MQQLLTEEEIVRFNNDGVLVVNDVLTHDQVETALQGLSETLSRYGVDTDNLSLTGHSIKGLSSTNGSGGVLDCFYEDWRMEIASNPKLFRMTTELWKSMYYHCGEEIKKGCVENDDDVFRWHPYGPFDTQKGYMYIDRIGYRIPTILAEKLGAELQASRHWETSNTNEAGASKKKKKKCSKPIPIQRSLTPHLDCCPENLFTEKKKWRPIQCFVSLTDTIEANHGGFEAAIGFHKNFHRWAKSRPPTVITKKNKKKGTLEQSSSPAPCIGEYSHIRPREDCDVMKRIKHIPVKAGSAVFWDNRIPHANAYRHDGDTPRCVVYCSFLPDVAINRCYVSDQLAKWRAGVSPTDQWIKISGNNEEKKEDSNNDDLLRSNNCSSNGKENTALITEKDLFESNRHDGGKREGNGSHSWLTPLGRKLMGIDSW